MRQKGQAAILNTMGLAFIMLMVGGLAVDNAFVHTVKRGMDNAADSAALAASAELFKNTSPYPAVRQEAARSFAIRVAGQNMSNRIDANDIEFGFVDPLTGAYDSGNFTQRTFDPRYDATGGYNAVRVTVKARPGENNRPVPTLFTRFLGFQEVNAASQGVAIFGGGVSGMGGLRPLYLCQIAYDTANNRAIFNDVSEPEITFHNDDIEVGNMTINAAATCGGLGPGNFGLADFDGGGGGAQQFNDILKNGYNGVVKIGEDYGPKTGHAISSSEAELAYLKNNKVQFTIPLYSQTSGNGVNAKFRVSKIVGFTITDYNLNGNSKTWIKGKFTKTLCTDRCSYDAQVQDGNIASLRLVH